MLKCNLFFPSKERCCLLLHSIVMYVVGWPRPCMKYFNMTFYHETFPSAKMVKLFTFEASSCVAVNLCIAFGGLNHQGTIASSCIVLQIEPMMLSELVPTECFCMCYDQC